MPGYFEERIARIEAHLELPAFRPPPVSTLVPTGLTVLVGANRAATCTWTAIPDRPDLQYEVHEFETDPARTLKATVTGSTRTSSPLKGGWYEWGVRGRAPDGATTEFSERVRVFVGATPPPSPGTGSGGPVDLLPILRGWTLMRPTGSAEKPDNGYPTGEIPGLFFVRDGAVIYRTPTTGVTSKGSHYPRTESREATGGNLASWSNRTGRHVLTVDEAFIELPSVKPHVVGAQIHSGDDDVIQVRLEGTELAVHYEDGDKRLVLTGNYELGTRFSIQIVAADSQVKIIYNGVDKGDLPLSGTTWYWKVGCYCQSNPDKGDGEGNFGEVAVYAISSTHT